MRMSCEEIITEARAQWVEPEPYFITSVEALRWLNMAQADFVKHTKCLRHSVSISTVANQQEYPLDIDARIMDILWLLCDGEPVSPCTREQLDMYRPSWRQAAGGVTGKPLYYYVTGVYDAEFGFYPCPDAAYTITMYIVEEPPIIENANLSTTYPKISDQWHDALTYYVEWRGHRKNRNFDMATTARKYYEAQVQEAIVSFAHLQPERVHMMSGPEYLQTQRDIRLPKLPTGYGRIM